MFMSMPTFIFSALDFMAKTIVISQKSFGRFCQSQFIIVRIILHVSAHGYGCFNDLLYIKDHSNQPEAVWKAV